MLRGDPELHQGERSRMWGDVVEFYYRRGQIDRVLLIGNARMEDDEPDSLAAIYRGLPRFDLIEGDSIAVHFKEGKIHRTDVVGTAHSIYVPVDVEDEVAFNDVRGDTLVLHFARQRVREVEVRGDMSGTYHFVNIAAMTGPQPADSTVAGADSLTAAADSAGGGRAPRFPGRGCRRHLRLRSARADRQLLGRCRGLRHGAQDHRHPRQLGPGVRHHEAHPPAT